MEQSNFSPEFIIIAFGVFLALAGAIVTIGKAYDVIKSWRNPREQADQTLAQCRLDLETQKARADEQADEINVLRNGLIVTCQGVKALLEHALHNGNTGEMVEASKAIDKWLFSK